MWSSHVNGPVGARIVYRPLAGGWLNGVPIVRRDLTDKGIRSSIRATFMKVRSRVPCCRVAVTMIYSLFVIRAREKQSLRRKLDRRSNFFARDGLTSVSMVKLTRCNKPFCAKGVVPTSLRQHPFCSVLVAGFCIPRLQWDQRLISYCLSPGPRRLMGTRPSSHLLI